MNWSNITLEQYQEIVAILGTDLPEFNKELELVCYLFNLPKDEVLNMSIDTFKDYSAKLEFLKTPHEGNMLKEFNINDITFQVGWELQKRTAGQFIDLSELTKEQDMINDNLHKILAVICIPKGSKYDGDITDRAELFKKHLTMDKVFPISGFFLAVLKSSLPVIQDYLMRDVEKKKKELLEMIKASMSIGDGMPHLTN